MERHPQDLEHPEVPDYSKLCNFVPCMCQINLNLTKGTPDEVQETLKDVKQEKKAHKERENAIIRIL